MSVAKLSQNQRVLRLALSRCELGVCAVDFLLPNVVDGGKPITRLAARIKDLSDDGLRFTDGGTRHGVKVYILDRKSLADSTLPPSPPAKPGPSAELLSTAGGPSPAPRLAIFDYDEEAA